MKAFKAFEDLGREELIYFERSAITVRFLIVGGWGSEGYRAAGGWHHKVEITNWGVIKIN